MLGGNYDITETVGRNFTEILSIYLYYLIKIIDSPRLFAQYKTDIVYLPSVVVYIIHILKKKPKNDVITKSTSILMKRLTTSKDTNK